MTKPVERKIITTVEIESHNNEDDTITIRKTIRRTSVTPGRTLWKQAEYDFEDVATLTQAEVVELIKDLASSLAYAGRAS